uniref:hypothetical protein n=1 Tax=Bradyrhizobium sp. (strain ORS 278) TaxID=114615 RepID=UPI0002E3321D|nr:hypothetical protein [Bradyrhizobium sp. ORS 278]
MDDDPFNRRPPLSPFLEEVRRARAPAGLTATIGAILGGLALMFPFGCVMALMRREWNEFGGLFGPGAILAGMAVAGLVMIVLAVRRRWG